MVSPIRDRGGGGWQDRAGRATLPGGDHRRASAAIRGRRGCPATGRRLVSPAVSGGTARVFGRLRRQRRRLALCALLGGAAGGLIAGSGIGPGGWQAGATAGLAGAAAMSALTALVVLLAPGWRWGVLELAVLAFLDALAVRLGAPAGAATAAALIALFLVPSQIAALDRIRLPVILTARDERHIAVAVGRLWRALVPHVTGKHWDPHVRQVALGPEPGMFVYEYRALGGEPGETVTVLVFDLDEGRHFKTRDFAAPDPGGRPVTVTSHVMEPEGAGARLTVMEASWRQGLWTAFALWLDDYLGDHVDRLAAQIESRSDRSVRGAMLGATRRRP